MNYSNCGNSDYLNNVSAIVELGYVTRSTAGIAASILSMNTTQGEHFGTVGERGQWNVRLTGINVTEGGVYGTTWIYRFVTEEGNIAVWFSSRNVELVVNGRYALTGTVKKHQVYQSKNNTVLTRCKAVAI